MNAATAAPSPNRFALIQNRRWAMSAYSAPAAAEPIVRPGLDGLWAAAPAPRCRTAPTAAKTMCESNATRRLQYKRCVKRHIPDTTRASVRALAQGRLQNVVSQVV